MAKGTVNKVVLIGRLGADPEVRYSAGNAPIMITRVRLATNEAYTDKSGQKVEHTEWHRVTFMGKLAEIISEYARKGSLIYIEGRLRTSKWQDQSGQDRYMTEIMGEKMQFLGGKSDNEGQSFKSSSSQAQRPSGAPASAPVARHQEDAMGFDADLEVSEIADDDLPF